MEPVAVSPLARRIESLEQKENLPCVLAPGTSYGVRRTKQPQKNMQTEQYIGSISHGTLRTCDLLPVFLDAVEQFAPAHHEALMVQPFSFIPDYVQDEEDSEWWDSDEAAEKLEQLTEILQENAPEGTYFGAHEGDGSEFGFWPLNDE